MPSHKPVDQQGGDVHPLPHGDRSGDPATALSTLPDWWGILLKAGTGNSPPPVLYPLSKAIAPGTLLPVCYGAVRIGGSALQFGSVGGNEITNGWGVIAWCQGEIQSVDTFYCNGVPLSVYDDPSSLGYLHFTHYTGASGDPRHDGGGDIFGGRNTSNFGAVAYTYITVWRSPVLGAQWWKYLPNGTQNGIYEWAADVHGPKLYDPRLDSTNGGSGSQRYTDPTTWTYSNNPVLEARDVLRRYGNRTDAQIDDVSFAAMATASDGAGFTCNIDFTVSTQLDAALAPVLQTCNGTLIKANGKTGIYLDLPNAGAPVATLSEEDGDIWGLKYEWLSAQSRYTRVAVSFLNAAANYAQDQTPNVDDPGIVIGAVPVKAQVVNAPGINTLAAAIVLRDYLYNSQMNTFLVSGTMNSSGLLLQQGMKIHLTTLKGIDLDFIIGQIATDAQGFFQFVVQPYEASIYGSIPVSQPPPITVIPPNPTSPGNEITVTDASTTRQVVTGSPSNQTIYDLYQLIQYTLPTGGAALQELHVRGFAGTGALTKSWNDMAASEVVVPLTGNEPPPDGTHFMLSHPGIIETVKTLTYDPFGRLKNTSTATGPTRIMVKTITTANALSTGVTVDVAASSTSVDNTLGPADTGQGTMVEAPAGVLNGTNRLFTLSRTPSGSRIILIADGMPLRGGVDYARVGTAITFGWTANKPLVSLMAVYNYGMPDDGGGTPESTLPIGTVTTWTAGTIPAYDYYSVCWSPDLGLFAAIHQAGSGSEVVTSPDGATWTPHALSPSSYWDSICWGNGHFVAVGCEFGGTAYTATSADGITWSVVSGTYATVSKLTGVTWAPALSLFVALHKDTGDAVTSADGVTWAFHALAVPHAGWLSNCMCWSPDRALLVAVKPGNVMTSSNGTTWTPQTGPGGNCVCWSPDLGLFVAAGDFGNGHGIATSPDGVTWTTQTTPTAGGSGDWPTGGYTGVAWSETRRALIAVTSSVVGHEIEIISSVDGINWTIRTGLGGSASWKAIVAADTIDVIVAVGLSVAMRCLT